MKLFDTQFDNLTSIHDLVNSLLTILSTDSTMLGARVNVRF